MSDTIEITSFPKNPQAGTYTISGLVDTQQTLTNGTVDDVVVIITFIVNGKQIDQKFSEDVSGTNFTVDFEYTFDAGSFPVILGLRTEHIDGTTTVSEDVDSDSVNISVSTIETGVEEVGEQVGYQDAYNNRGNTIIENIQTDDDVRLNFSIIDFDPYNNPNISIDSGARFATHDIIGGSTVRQKIGEEPREFTINGVCKEAERRKIDRLHKATTVDLNSEATSDSGLIRCHAVSSSTDPLENGGAADMDGGEFLYEFNINLVEVEVIQ